MCIKKSLLSLAVVSVVAFGVVSCGGNKTAAPAGMSRGEKLADEECDLMAREPGTLRASASYISQNESHGTRTAENRARAGLARRLETVVNGMLRDFSQEYAGDQEEGEYDGKVTTLEQGFFNQALNNSRIICKNVYVQPDGRFNIFVAVEMDEKAKEAIVKQLKEKRKINTDYNEEKFNKDLDDRLAKESGN